MSKEVILEYSKQPLLSKDELFAIDLQLLIQETDVNRLHQIAESAAYYVDTESSDLNKQEYAINVTDELRHSINSLLSELDDCALKLNIKNAKSITVATKTLEAMSHTTDTKFNITGEEYNHILVAFSSEILGSVALARYMTTVTELLEDVSKLVAASREELGKLNIIYTQVADLAQQVMAKQASTEAQ